MKNKFLKLFLSLILVLALCACGKSEKTFEEEGFKITLTNEFAKKDLENFTYYYQSLTSFVTALNEPMTTLEYLGLSNASTVEDYLTEVASANKKEADIKTRNNYAYFDFESTTDNNTFYYLCAAYKSDNGFWLLNFGCKAEDKDKMSEQFLTWADSVEV